MQWTRSETIALAKHSCTQCLGLGLRHDQNETYNACNCVLRAIFRACYARFRQCVNKEKHISRVSLEYVPGKEGKFTWGRKDEEYIADFCLVSRRTLNEFEYKIFKYHFLLGADWRLCARRLKVDRGNFFHSVYRIEQKLGRVFSELQPYGLYLLDEYFHGERGAQRKPISVAALSGSHTILAPPLLRTA